MYDLEKRYIPTISTNNTPMEYNTNTGSRDDSKLFKFFIESAKNAFRYIDRYKYKLKVKKK